LIRVLEQVSSQKDDMTTVKSAHLTD
jgi:hypothetical protein